MGLCFSTPGNGKNLAPTCTRHTGVFRYCMYYFITMSNIHTLLLLPCTRKSIKYFFIRANTRAAAGISQTRHARHEAPTRMMSPMTSNHVSLLEQSTQKIFRKQKRSSQRQRERVIHTAHRVPFNKPHTRRST
ncbi:unnamed protein product [Ectocarpus fasciculatus]